MSISAAAEILAVFTNDLGDKTWTAVVVADFTSDLRDKTHRYAHYV